MKRLKETQQAQLPLFQLSSLDVTFENLHRHITIIIIIIINNHIKMNLASIRHILPQHRPKIAHLFSAWLPCNIQHDSERGALQTLAQGSLQRYET